MDLSRLPMRCLWPPLHEDDDDDDDDDEDDDDYDYDDDDYKALTF